MIDIDGLENGFGKREADMRRFIDEMIDEAIDCLMDASQKNRRREQGVYMGLQDAVGHLLGLLECLVEKEVIE